jgi:hypothetical protein
LRINGCNCAKERLLPRTPEIRARSLSLHPRHLGLYRLNAQVAARNVDGRAKRGAPARLAQLLVCINICERTRKFKPGRC